MKKKYFSPIVISVEIATERMIAASFTDTNVGSGGVGHVDAGYGGSKGDAPAFNPNLFEE